MNILQFIEFNKKKIGLVIVLSLCCFIFVPILSGELPLGRDWSRYWHPHLHYFKAVGTSFGVVWQEGGGFLTSYDPSTLVWDPIWQVINYVFSYGPSIAVYLCLYYCLGIASFYYLCARASDPLIAAAIAVAYAYSGLSLSVLHQQFLPIVFAAPAAALAFIRFNEVSSVKRLILSVVAFYYVGYTAVPNIAVLCWFFGAIYAWKNQLLKKYFVVSVYAAIFLIPTYTGLVLSKLAGVSPDSTRWYNWSFSIPRIFSLIIPEGSFDQPSMIWYSHLFGGDEHKIEPYFRSVLVPVWVIGAWIGYGIYSETKNARMVAIMSFLVLLMSMIGYAPSTIRDMAWSIPFFWSRYPEKFLLIFMPLMFYGASAFISKNLNDKNKLLKSQLFALIVLLLVGLHNLMRYSDFSHAVFQTSIESIILLIGSLALFLFGIFIKNIHIKGILLLISVLLCMPISHLQFSDARGELGNIVTKRSHFLNLNETMMLNSRVYIHPSASVPYCMNKNKNKNPFACSDFDFEAIFLF